LPLSSPDANRPHHDRPAILHVINCLEGGGTERTLLGLLQRLAGGGDRHLVVTLRRAGTLAQYLPDSVACVALDAGRRSWTAGVRLAGIVRRSKAEIIHARNTGCWFDAVVAGALTRTRIVLGFHGLEYEGRFCPRHRRLARTASWLGARFTTVSDAGRRKLHDEAGVRLERIDVLANGVSLDRFRPAERVRAATRSRLGLHDTDCVVGIVAALSPVKQHSLLISAVAEVSKEIPALHLVIVGDGPLRSALERQAAACGLARRVHFTGWHEDTAPWLSAMDIYACCSAAEGMSNALLEAMASGLATITTDVGDHAAIVRHQTDGLVTRPGCATELASAIRTLAAAPALRETLAGAARDRARDFRFDTAVRVYRDYYRTWLPAPRPASGGMASITPQTTATS
jgi:glycosyltransferase involved in cell wall biosynthesis